VGKAGSLPLSGAPERCFNWVDSCLPCKQYTILQRLARDEHSSLLQKFVANGSKKFNNIGPWDNLKGPLAYPGSPLRNEFLLVGKMSSR
jgi:hypothetical protein